jgi:hypothetical protein
MQRPFPLQPKDFYGCMYPVASMPPPMLREGASPLPLPVSRSKGFSPLQGIRQCDCSENHFEKNLKFSTDCYVQFEHILCLYCWPVNPVLETLASGINQAGAGLHGERGNLSFFLRDSIVDRADLDPTHVSSFNFV